MDQRYAQTSYLVRKKILKLLGGTFEVFGSDEKLLFYSKMKAFKLREAIRVYSDDSMSTELLSIHARVEKVGNTSVTVHVEAWAERNPSAPFLVKVTEAKVTYVAIDSEGRPRPIPKN